MMTEKQSQECNSPGQLSTSVTERQNLSQVALEHYRAKRLDKSAQCYLDLLQQQPNSAESLQMLGVIAWERGNVSEAIAYQQRLIALQPDNVDAYNNLGAFWARLGDLDRAKTAYERALALQPNHAAAHNNLGNIAKKQGQLEEAIACYQTAISYNTNYPEAQNNLGIALQKCGRLAEAIAAYQQALQLNPNYVEAYCNLGVVFNQQKKIDEAIASFQKALALKPDYPEATHNLAATFMQQDWLEEAIATYRQALSLRPHFPEAYNNLGAALKKQEKFSESIACYQQAVAQKPDYADAFHNLGAAFQELNLMEKAIANFRHAVALSPEDAMARSRLAMGLLLSGNFAEGFAEYEWRWQTEGFEKRLFSQPCWDGSPLPGKTILLYPEQGFGDLIQFIRYVPLVAELCGRVIVETNPALRDLFTTVPGVKQVVIKGESLPEFDVQCPILSLPHLLGTTRETIPVPIPYLRAENGKTLPIPQTPFPRPQLKVGIAWQVNHQSITASKRSCQLEYFLKLLEVSGVTLYSLAKEQQIPETIPIIDLSQDLQTFADTANFIEQLDLVITVDTAVGHLAGALGKRVWVLLPFSPDWRWLLAREDTPWYPTMRLFRQDKPGNWQSVFERVKMSLQEILDEKKLDRKTATEVSVEELLAIADGHERAGRREIAESICQQLIKQRPKSGKALNLLGVFRQRRGRTKEAIAYYEKAIAADPNYAGTYNNIGLACWQQNLREQAIEYYRKAIALKPEDTTAYYNLGKALEEVGKTEEAIAAYQKLLAWQPDHANAYNKLATIQKNSGQLDEAIANFQKAIQYRPNFPGAYNRLGNTFKKQGRIEEAIAQYKKAIELRPDYMEVYNNLGLTLQTIGRGEEAIAYYNKALALQPENASVHFGKAFTLLSLGNYQEGLAEYEWRWHEDIVPPRQFSQPLWDGSGLGERTLLLYTEQGLGDAIQFIRYLPSVKQRGGTIILECQACLAQLFTTVSGVDTIVVKDTQLPEFDLQAPLMSLPRILGTTIEAIPAEIPYLHPGELSEFPLGNSGKTDTIKIGIVWRGNLAYEHDCTRYRTCDLNYFLELVDLSGITWYSLQKDVAAVERKRLEAKGCICLGDRFSNFADTAAAIAQLDLIISIDTAVAHLAGAMGKLTWVLLPFASDWRWLLDRCDSPWYPTMQLFRQPTPGNWQAIFTQVKTALQDRNWQEAKTNDRQFSARTMVPEILAIPSVNSALTHHQAGRFGEAEDLYRQIIKHQPQNDRALQLLGVLNYQRGKAQEAVGWITKAIALEPKIGEYHSNLSAAYRSLGQLELAMSHAKQAIALQPDCADAYNNLGVALKEKGQLAEAIANYRLALEKRPNYPDAHNNLTIALKQQGELQQVIHHHQQALSTFKNADPDEHFNLGVALQQKGRLTEAIAEYQRTLQLVPNHPEALHNLGTALHQSGYPDEAIAKYREVLTLKPDYVDAYNNLGNALYEKGELSEAIASYSQAIALDPENVEGHFARSLTLLHAKDFPRGFIEYEWRWQLPHRTLPPFPQPLWDGSSLEGKTILVHTEQGMGDSIQFIRYIPQLAQKGAKIIVGCGPALTRLFATVAGIDRIVRVVEGRLHFDVHSPLMSLPRLVGTTFDTIPAEVPYLGQGLPVDAHLKLNADNKVLNVGIVWQAGTFGESKLQSSQRQRSCDLSYFQSVLDIQGIKLYSLQKEPAVTDKQKLASADILDLSDRLTDFADTAIIISQLDLVITVDTSVAHLAGAMGKPVWVLLPFAPDWRWTLNREDSPWYPTMRLFRQTKGGDWLGVFERVKTALSHLNFTIGTAGSALRISPQLDPKIDERIAMLRQQGYHASISGQLEAAAGFYQQVLELKPDVAQIHRELGLVLKKQGKLEAAIACYQQAIKLEPDYLDVYINLGVSLRKVGRVEEAIASYQKALELNPNNPGIHNNLGNILRDRGCTKEALNHYQQALALKPDYLDALMASGYTYQADGQLDEAIARYKEALDLQPNLPQLHCNLGVALRENECWEEAEQHYQQALELDANCIGAYINWGLLLQEDEQLDEAIALYQKAIAIDPNYADAHHNLAVTFQRKGQTDRAIAHYQKAISIKPDFGDPHLGLSMSWLLVGDFQRGFAEYEWRITDMSQYQPFWDGSSLEGKTILLQEEQGFGDTIHFIRYAPLVKALGGRVIVRCKPPLIRLFSTMDAIDEIVPKDDPLPEFDVQVPLLSLPRIFGTTLETIPAQIPYLYPPEKQPIPLPPTRGPLPQLKVGIVWAGSSVHKNDKNRSASLSQFLPFLENREIAFYSLQKGPQSQDITPEINNLISLDEQINDFADTAAIVSQLDLVITVDTSVGHLVGAVGKPVWVLLSFAADWRWLLERQDSPWYPTMRLFRQASPGDWPSVFAKVKSALETFLSNRDARSTDNLPQTTQSPEYYRYQGIICKKEGRLEEAIANYKQALKLRPNWSDVYINLGVVQRKVGKLEEAITSYKTALELNANNPSVHNNLGNVLRETGKLEEAIAHYQQAIQLNPNYADALMALGSSLQEQEKNEEAIAYYQKVIALHADNPLVYNNLGIALKDTGKPDEAIPHFQKAIALDPNYAGAYSNLGLVLQEKEMLDEAIAYYEKAVAVDPNYAEAYHNYGVALNRKCQLTAAISRYQQAIALKNDFADAHLGLSMSLLQSGYLKEGFSEYEWRWQVKTTPKPNFNIPLWDGSSLVGKTILLHEEQGFGDTIQFIRYAWSIKQLGCQVIFTCKQPLSRLLATVEGIDQVIVKGEPLPECDVRVPLLSLPYILGTTLETIPTAIPYIQVVEKKDLPIPLSPCPMPKLKVGIVWAGSPKNKNDRHRSVRASQFSQLLEIPGIAFYSLQKGPPVREISELSNIISLEEYLADFADTAAVIEKLDLVITVDTSVAHLAGALSKPVWVLLCYSPDWRWILDRDDSPWYPTMVLFRQTSPGDWNSVFTRVKTALEGKLMNHSELLNNPLPDTQQGLDGEPNNYPSSPDRLPPLSQVQSLLSTGVEHHQAGRFPEAEGIYRQILQVQPNQVDARQLLGTIAYQTGKTEEAIAHYQQALKLNPNYPEVHNNLGAAFWKLGNAEAAIAAYREAIQLKPNYADAHHNLGIALRHQKQTVEAIAAFREAIALKPNYAEAHTNIGLALREIGELDEAIAHYEKSLDLRPNHPETHLYLAIALLLKGDLRRGFAEYEWRWHQPGFSLGHYLHNVWDGSPIKGKTILLRGEQGLGDAIQFIRYAPLVKAQGCRVVVECQKPLVRLLQTADGIDEIVVKGEALPHLDLQVPLMSLPRILGTTLDTIPDRVPYLGIREFGGSLASQVPLPDFHLPMPDIEQATDPDRCPIFQRQLQVGIVWAGSPQNKTDEQRSCGLSHFLPLLPLQGITFYSLQKGPRTAELTDDIKNIISLDKQLNDFADTAAAILQLDLVITIDTAVAHLAGALAKPVWVLLPYAPDWRWLCDRDDSPWYPTMRLFRQLQPLNWLQVFVEVREALQALI